MDCQVEAAAQKEAVAQESGVFTVVCLVCAETVSVKFDKAYVSAVFV